MTGELQRANGVSPLVERQLACELSDYGLIFIDPEVSLMTSVCGIASHSLALFLKEKRGHGVQPYIGSIPKMTAIDRGFEYRHVLLRDPSSGTIIDPTPLQVLSFAGYHLNYIADHFSWPPQSLVGDVRIAEFPDTTDGVSEFAAQMTEIVMRVREAAYPVRSKLEMFGGQPFLDMGKEEIHRTMRDMWDMSHYQPYPNNELDADFDEQATYIAKKLLEADGQSV